MFSKDKKEVFILLLKEKLTLASIDDLIFSGLCRTFVKYLDSRPQELLKICLGFQVFK